ncbi:MAG: amidase family protein, partial [Nevskia sp.]
DNIEAKGPVPTTAGSTALLANVTERDAPLVARLRAAGAIILGKTNLSQWANIRSDNSVSGWSSVGGLVKNPYALDRNSCGSSSGSGAAAAASLAAATIGTETDGSIICPSSINGLVGFKPTLGLVSRTHVIPISHSQDTAGPMARSVTDAALVLTALAGSDPADPATAQADARKTDYAAGLSPGYLQGVRIGVLKDRTGSNARVQAVFAGALDWFAAAGAELVEIEDSRTGLDGLGEAEFKVLMAELKADLNAYLASTPATVKARTLKDIIAYNAANAVIELAWFDQG